MAKRQRRSPTIAELAVALLRERGPMHYRDVTTALEADGVEPQGRTFSQTVSAALIRSPDAERVAPSVYKAKDEP
jgi:hypothetical protein